MLNFQKTLFRKLVLQSVIQNLKVIRTIKLTEISDSDWLLTCKIDL